jgi:hypothetical protein
MKRSILVFILVFLMSVLAIFVYRNSRVAAEEEYVCCECMDGGESTRQWVLRSFCEQQETCNIIYLDHDQCHN